MRFFARLILILALLTSFCALPGINSEAYAQGEFKTDYKVQYTIDSQGTTNVTQQIVLTNNTANFYADKFDLKIGSTKVDNVKASDASGPMEVDVKFENNVTAISVKFNQRVIGVGKTLPWTLSYTSTELATKSGQIWEISIPRVSDSGDIGTYDAQVQVPESFGPIAYAVPEPISSSQTRASQDYAFNKDQLTQSGIAMSFGQKQVFSFNLNYYLENKNLTSRVETIALPPDTNYQRVVLEKIDPRPQNIDVDADGNFLAKYKLAPKQKIDVVVAGSVEVFSTPNRNINAPLTPAQKDAYTQPQRYWETDNAFVREKASELKTPQKIYEFTTQYLKYSQNRKNQVVTDYVSIAKDEQENQSKTTLNRILSIFKKPNVPQSLRRGAAKAALSPNDAICLEFTDLFIAIARSAGIPAREVNGYAYTQNERLRPLSLPIEKDVLHSWPEYWDDELGWVQIDPTWGSTSGGLDYFNKMDFNHIAFVKKGMNSQTPYPPGTFRRPQDIDKNLVQVSFAQDLPQPYVSSELELTVPKKAIAGIPTKASLTIQNNGNASILGEKLSIQTALNLSGQSENAIEILPPFAKRSIGFRIQPNSFFSKEQSDLTATFAQNSKTQTVSIVPIYFLILSPGFAFATALSIAIIIAGFHLHSKFHLKKRRI